MQVQLSVAYHGYLLSYQIRFTDLREFEFKLKSAPDDAEYAPVHFTVSGEGKRWTFTPPLDKAFQRSVLNTLKKIPKKP